MKANELRIGNLIYSKGLLEYRKVHYGMLSLNNDRFNELYEPIPLTPEILEKAGFVKGLSSAIHRRQDYQMERFGIICICNSENQFFVNGRLVVLKYVHQLQNLYFALTGEELNIEL